MAYEDKAVTTRLFYRDNDAYPPLLFLRKQTVIYPHWQVFWLSELLNTFPFRPGKTVVEDSAFKK